VVILHSLSVASSNYVRKVRARLSIEELRAAILCTVRAIVARWRTGAGAKGMASTVVRSCGLSEGWMVIWVRRYVCRDVRPHDEPFCRIGCIRGGWYAAAVIIEALYRHLILDADGGRDRRAVRCAKW